MNKLTVALLLTTLSAAVQAFKPPASARRFVARQAAPTTVTPTTTADADEDEPEEEPDDVASGAAIKDLATLLEVPTIQAIGTIDRILKLGRKFDGPIQKSLSTLQEFDANLDIILYALSGGALIRKKALTWENVSRADADYSEQILNSYEWKHEFFPGIKTRAFDPTLKLDQGYEQVPATDNAIVEQAFDDKGAIVQKLTREVFRKPLKMTPASQGVWNDKWAGEGRMIDELGAAERFEISLKEKLPGSDFFLRRKMPDDPFPVASDLAARTDWLTNQYYTPEPKSPTDPWSVSQDMSLRYLGSWNPEREGFSDEMFSQFYMASIGQSFVHAVDPSDSDAGDAAYVAPLNWASTARVRKGQGKYGGDVYFDSDGMVSHIKYLEESYQPGDDGWDLVKTKCRATVLMVLTGYEHLLGCHLHFSNSLSMATPTLPSDHPLRRLLWPHIFNAVGVNRKAAATLSVDGGLFTRGWGVKLKGIHAGFDYVKDSWDLFVWQTPRERYEARGLGALGEKMPLWEDGNDFYDVVRAYVGDFVDLHYADDAAVAADTALRGFHSELNEHLLNKDLPFLATKAVVSDVLATYIYYVTGYHTHVGTAHGEAADQGVAPSAYYDNAGDDQGGSPPNSAAWAFFTYLGTASLTLPITGDTRSTEWKAGFKEKQDYLWQDTPEDAPAPADQPPVEPVGYPAAFEGFPAEIAANKAFATGLVALQQKIMARNKARHAGDGVPPALARAYNGFDVNFVESSIAI